MYEGPWYTGMDISAYHVPLSSFMEVVIVWFTPLYSRTPYIEVIVLFPAKEAFTRIVENSSAEMLELYVMLLEGGLTGAYSTGP